MTRALTLSPSLTLTLTPTLTRTRRIAQLDRAKLLASLVPVHTEAYPLPQQADLSPSPTPSPTPNSALTTTTTTTTSLRPAPYDPPEQAGHSALPEHRHFFSGITPDVRERLQARAARGHAQLPKRSRKKE